MQLALLPGVPDVRFIEHGHTYWAWASRSASWIQIRSVSGIKKAGGLGGFDRGGWRRSLVKKGLTWEEADTEMDRHMECRASIGTAFHDLVRAYCLGQQLRPDDGEAWAIFEAWRRDFLPHIRTVLLLEQPIVHRWWFYAGMPDMVAVLEDGRVWLLDWKTKAEEAKCRPSADWVHQLVAYVALVLRQYGLRVDRVANVMAYHGGVAFHPWSLPEVEVASRQFVDALLVHHSVLGLAGCPYHQAICERLLQPGATLPPLWV